MVIAGTGSHLLPRRLTCGDSPRAGSGWCASSSEHPASRTCSSDNGQLLVTLAKSPPGTSSMSTLVVASRLSSSSVTTSRHARR